MTDATMPGGLVGIWQLETWTARGEGGEVFAPFCERPVGLLVLTSDGWLSAHVAARNRLNFEGSLLGEPAEQANAFATYTGYAGPCRIDGDRLVTTVKVCSLPNLLGTEQTRDVQLTDDVLVLIAPSLGGASHEFRWRRVSATASQGAGRS